MKKIKSKVGTQTSSEIMKDGFLAILDSAIQGKKYGTQLLDMAKEANKEVNRWVIKSDSYIKVNGNTYKSPIEFYRKNGFKILDNTQLKNNQISAIKVQWVKTGYNSDSFQIANIIENL